MAEKTKGQQLNEVLGYAPKNAFECYSGEEMKKVHAFAKEYCDFLNKGKTEREFVKEAVADLTAAGYKPFVADEKLKKGDKRYFINRNKCLVSVCVGEKNPAEGVRIIMAHIDSPRLDLKPRPLKEASELAFFKTNYYGGIRKYQWPAVPLALHGVVYLKDGSCKEICIGEEANDPCFTVTDLLPHLAKNQAGKPVEDIVIGEHLNLLIGSQPYEEKDTTDPVKLTILQILNEKYGMIEEDFISAELEAVPAYPARDLGLDRSMVGGYGQDDKVCAYPCHRAMLAVTEPEYTTVCLLCDKEEIGSEGNTGLNSRFFLYFLEDLAACFNVPSRTMLTHSLCLSADVTPAFDPAWPEVHDQMNASFLNHGVAIMKYSGSRGKYDTSDASAETMRYFRKRLNEADIPWQIGCLGAVDAGGGGTLAKYIAMMNVDVLDIGVPVLSMHSPYEVTAKTDIYAAYQAFAAFLAMDPRF